MQIVTLRCYDIINSNQSWNIKLKDGKFVLAVSGDVSHTLIFLYLTNQNNQYLIMWCSENVHLVYKLLAGTNCEFNQLGTKWKWFPLVQSEHRQVWWRVAPNATNAGRIWKQTCPQYGWRIIWDELLERKRSWRQAGCSLGGGGSISSFKQQYDTTHYINEGCIKGTKTEEKLRLDRRITDWSQ